MRISMPAKPLDDGALSLSPRIRTPLSRSSSSLEQEGEFPM
jgi:hypothetical protein